jgi:hypothetical protein
MMARSKTVRKPSGYVSRKVFKPGYNQLLTLKMRFILGYYKKNIPKHATKPVLVKLLGKLESEIEPVPAVAIEIWLKRGTQSPHEFGVHLDMLYGVRINPEERTNSPPKVKLDCSVCMESLDSENFPAQKITSLCKHDPTICRHCLTQFLDAKIPNVAFDQVTCPLCPEVLPYDAVKMWACEQSFEQYELPVLIKIQN